MPGTLIGVGVGPGDPELVTRQAVRVLREADRVVAPSLADDAIGRAESIVRQVTPELRVERLVFNMTTTTSALRTAHDAAADRLVPYLDAGERVAFATLGDPNIYSTFSALVTAVRRQRPGAGIDTVAGIMAFQDLAALTGTVLLAGAESLRLVTALDGPDSVRDALGDDDQAVVVYKGGRHMPAIVKVLADAGRIEGAVVGELLGLPGQRIAPATNSTWTDQGAAYLATLIVPPAHRARS